MDTATRIRSESKGFLEPEALIAAMGLETAQAANKNYPRARVERVSSKLLRAAEALSRRAAS